MRRSLSLALYMLAAARGGPAKPVERAPRPEGPVIWVHAGTGATLRSLGQLLRRIAEARGGVGLLMTVDGAADLDAGDLPRSTLFQATPEDRVAEITAFLDHWRPDLFILAGTTLPPAMIVEAAERGIPALFVDARFAPQWHWPGFFRTGMTAALLSRFDRILAQDPDTARRLRGIAGREVPVEVTGRIEETTEPLKCSEAEWAELAELLQARPVWLAANCPQAEEEAVLAAHGQALRFAHRMLLILNPADPARAAVLKERCLREGWEVALRSADEDPEPGIQVLIAEGDAELGLWYRLAPVTFMGGTLVEGGAGRTPYEPAALGSAILHGPHPGPYPDAYGRLGEARATRLVATAGNLAAAVADLIAPDKAALLAHNAWAASSGGAEVAERVLQIILAMMDSRAGPGGKGS